MTTTPWRALYLMALMPAAGCALLQNPIERNLNLVATTSDEIAALERHCPDCDEIRDFFMADLHADTLLWGRDPLAEGFVGHVDIHRLRQAGVDLQVFSVPSFTPLGRAPRGAAPAPDQGDTRCTNKDENIDTAGLLFEATARGKLTARQIAYTQAFGFCEMTGGTWTGPRTGAVAGAPSVCSYADDLTPALTVTEGSESFFPVRSVADLKALRAAIDATPPGGTRPVGALLSIEGVHWIDEAGEVEPEIAALKAAGFRMIGLTHKFTNGIAGSDEDCADDVPGLKPDVGALAVTAVLDQGLILDVAHLSARGVFDPDRPAEVKNADALSIASAHPSADREAPGAPWMPRMVMSHGAPRFPGCARSVRNLPDAQVRKLLEARVPFGIIHWDRVLCAGDGPRELIVERILDSYQHAIDLTDPRTATHALALGADLDGAVRAPFDVTGFPLLLSRMRQETWCRRLAEAEPGPAGQSGQDGCTRALQRIAGGNIYDFLLRALPLKDG